MMTITQKSFLAVATAAFLAMVAAHCSGCALVQPEGDMTMEVSDGQ